MIYSDKIDLSEEIDFSECKDSKGGMVCHY